MIEALEHIANLKRPAKRSRLVERHRDAAIDLEEDPDDQELARASAASADFIKGLTMADLTKFLRKGANYEFLTKCLLKRATNSLPNAY